MNNRKQNGGQQDEPEPPKGVDKDWLVTRITMPVLREAMILVDQNIANEADIDIAMKLGASFPAGPFETAKSIGFIKKLNEELGDCYSVPKYLEK